MTSGWTWNDAGCCMFCVDWVIEALILRQKPICTITIRLDLIFRIVCHKSTVMAFIVNEKHYKDISF